MTKLVYKQLLHYYVLWIRSSEQVWNRQCLLGIWRRQWHPTPVLLPGKSHGQKSQVGCSPWGHEESDTTEWLPFHFSLSCTGEGNGNPLQCSCLENPRDGRAWWAAVYGVTQSRTRLMRLSSSSSKRHIWSLSTSTGLLDRAALSNEKYPAQNFTNQFWQIHSVTAPYAYTAQIFFVYFSCIFTFLKQ